MHLIFVFEWGVFDTAQAFILQLRKQNKQPIDFIGKRRVSSSRKKGLIVKKKWGINLLHQQFALGFFLQRISLLPFPQCRLQSG